MVRRVKQSKQPKVLFKHGVRFVDLPVSKRMLTLQVDYTKEPTEFNHDIKALKGAVIKPVIRYNDGDDVRDEVAGLLANMEMSAAHVRPPVYEVVRTRRRRVDDGFGDDLTMLQAAEAYMDARPPNVSKDDVVGLLASLFEQVEGDGSEKTRINPFVVKRVVVEGFMPFRERQEIVLGEGVFGVVGLNRAGKSSFLDAIEFALTGETGRKPRSNDKFIHTDVDTATVEVELDFEGEPFTIVRRINKKGSTSADATGCKGGKVGEVNEFIRNRIGVGKQDLLWTCIVRQRELGGLLGQTSAPMQDALFRWLGIDAWTKAEKLADVRVKEIEKKHSALLAVIDALKQRLEDEPPGEDDIVEARVQYNAARNYTEAYEKAQDKYDSLVASLDLFELASTLPQCKDELEAAEMHKAQIEQELDGRRDTLAALKRDYNAAAELSREGFDGVCPVDGVDCPRTCEINEGVETFKEAELKASEVYRSAKRIYDDLVNDLARADDVLSKARMAHERAERAVSEFPSGTKRVDLVADIKKADKELQAIEQAERGDVVELRRWYEGLLTASARYDEDMAKIEETRIQLDAVNEDLVIARYVRLLCSRRGVPSMVVEGAIGVVEQAANDILERLGTPHRLEFSFETEIKKPATTCRGCGAHFPKSAKVKECEACGESRGREVKHELAPWIVEGPGGHDYAMDSGGGQDLIALAVRVALSRFMGATLLLIDEACANLDVVNVAAFTQMVARLGSVGFEQVLMSSHRAEVKESTERLVVVERDGGASVVTVE